MTYLLSDEKTLNIPPLNNNVFSLFQCSRLSFKRVITAMERETVLAVCVCRAVERLLNQPQQRYPLSQWEQQQVKIVYVFPEYNPWLSHASNTGGADYGPIDSRPLTFVPGGTKVMCALFTIVDDKIIEDEESFLVSIESVSPTPGVVIGAQDVTTILIVDNDSKYLQSV